MHPPRISSRTFPCTPLLLLLALLLSACVDHDLPTGALPGGLTQPDNAVFSTTTSTTPQVAAGYRHACVLRSDDVVECWGLSGDGAAKSDQWITFTSTPPSPGAVGGSYATSATSTSGLPVSFSSFTESVCTLSGSTVSLLTPDTCTIAADQAGNANYLAAPQVTRSLTVVPGSSGSSFGGFTGPVVNPLQWNRSSAGQTVPLKFSLGGYRGMDIVAAGYPTSRRIACDLDGAPNSQVPAGTTLNGGLSYDGSTDQYQLNWKAEKSWRNSCRELLLQLDDGARTPRSSSSSRQPLARPRRLPVGLDPSPSRAGGSDAAQAGSRSRPGGAGGGRRLQGHVTELDGVQAPDLPLRGRLHAGLRVPPLSGRPSLPPASRHPRHAAGRGRPARPYRERREQPWSCRSREARHRPCHPAARPPRSEALEAELGALEAMLPPESEPPAAQRAPAARAPDMA